MNSLYKWLMVFAVALLLIQFGCEDNVTGLKNDPVDKWYGHLSVDFVHSILKRESTVWSWGTNVCGTLGNGSTKSSDYPVRAVGLNNVISFDQSYGAQVAVDKNGDIWFWGNIWIYLGLPTIDTNVTVPIKLLNLDCVKAISMNSVFIFLLKNDGNVWIVKLDWYSPTIVDGPRKIEGISNVVSIQKNIALTIEGKIYNLLSNTFLQNSLENIIAVSGREGRHILALKEDGTVWAWGKNNLGQLGNGTYDDSEVPTKVNALNNVIAISANYDFNLALKADRTVWFWGFIGRQGETLIGLNSPVKIEGLENIILVCAGSECLVMKEDGTYWTFSVEDRIAKKVHFN